MIQLNCIMLFVRSWHQLQWMIRACIVSKISRLLKSCLNKRKLLESTAISLLGHDFDQLPDDLACPRLELLLMFDKNQVVGRYQFMSNPRPILFPK